MGHSFLYKSCHLFALKFSHFNIIRSFVCIKFVQVSDLLVDINIDNFVSCLNLAKDENVQINLVRIIGRLGCAVAKHPAVHSTSLKVIVFLLRPLT